MSQTQERGQGRRRIDRIREDAFVQNVEELSLEELRGRRSECLAEREYLSLLRRLVQGRAEILRAELEARRDGNDEPLVDRLAAILSDGEPGGSRGEVMRVEVPDEELLLARRRVERLVADAGLSDPAALGDEALAEAVDLLAAEERTVSEARRGVLDVLDLLQAELTRRYREDPTLALR